MRKLIWLTLLIPLIGCLSQHETDQNVEMDELAKCISTAHSMTRWDKFECEIVGSDNEGIDYKVTGLPYVDDDYLMFRILKDGTVEHFPVP